MPWEKNFDEDVALRRAGETFWTHGYDATSMTDLLDAMGIQKGSFYATFGSKRDAYLRSLEQYVDERFADFRDAATGMEPRRGLETLIELVFEDCAGREGHRGCMLINCALELAHTDTKAQRIVQSALDLHAASYAELITAAQKTGSISSRLDADATSKGLLAIVIGMRVYARSGAPRATLRVLADQALALIG